MLKFEYYDSSELTEQDIQDLWDQNVNMDDWDYMLFSEVEGSVEKVEWISTSPYFQEYYDATDYNVQKLLQGCCSNKWYKVKNFKGRRGILGVAYHA